MTEKKTPAKRKSHGRVPQAYGTIDPDFSDKVLMWNIELFKYRNDKPKTVDEMKDTVEAYFRICSKYKLIPTVERTFDYYSLRYELSERHWQRAF